MNGRFIGISALAILFSIPLVAAQEDDAMGEGALAFYLHNVGSACEDGAFELFMDTEDSEGDQDGCGTLGGGVVDAQFETSYPSKEELGLNVVDGTTAISHIFVSTANPSDVTASGTFSVGKKRCSGASETQQVTNAYGVISDFVELTFECVFEGKDDANGTATKKPSFTLTVASDGSVFYGYEGDHASYIEISGLSQALPTAGEVVASEPAEESPGPGSLLALVAVAATGLVALRRRD